MNVKTVLAHAASLLAICSVAGSAVAQTAPAAGATNTGPQTPALPGAPITGVCYFSMERLFAQSTAGRSVQTRLQQITTQVTAELNTERTALENDVRAFNGQRATLDQTAAEQRAAQLQLRQNSYQRKEQLRQREMQVTYEYAVRRLQEQALPVMMQVATQRQCSILVNDNVVLAANAAMDLTPAVITGLNARATSITFDRIQVNPQTGQPILPGAGAAAAPAARPATPAPR